MPIQVKDYDWEETNETVLLTIPLKGVPSNRVDIFSVDDYIKVCINLHAILNINLYCVATLSDNIVFLDKINALKS